MGVNESVIAVVALLVTFGMPIFIVAMALIYKARKDRLTHATMLELAEKGVPIPPELIVTPQRRIQSDLKRGIVLVSAGIGISVFFSEVGGPISLGAIPALMGLGYIVAWKIEQSPRSGS